MLTPRTSRGSARRAAAAALACALSACVPTLEEPGPDAGLKEHDGALSLEDGSVQPDEDASVGEDAGLPTDAGVDAGPEPDQDGDGLPDSEDPSPRVPNPLLFRDRFDQGAEGWLFSSVSMAIDPDRGVLAVTRLEPFEREGWIGPQPSWGNYLVRTRMRVDAVGTSERPESGHAGVIARVQQVTPSRYVTCGVDLRSGRAVLAEHEGTARRTLAAAPANIAPGEWFPLSLMARAAALRCRIGGIELVASSDTFPSGSVGFRSYDATFAADFLEVYEVF